MFDKNLCLKIQSCIQPEILMRVPRIAVGTGMGASTIWIDAVPKRNIWRVIFRNDAL